MYYTSVIVPLNIDTKLTYSSNDIVSIGSLILVEVNSKDYIGIITDISNTPSISNLSIKGIKKILYPNCYDKKFVQLMSWMASYYMTSLGSVLKQICIPPKNTKKIINPIQPKKIINIPSDIVLNGTTLVHGANRINTYISAILKYQQYGSVIIIAPRIDRVNELNNLIGQYIEHFVYHSECTTVQKYSTWAYVKDHCTVIIGTKIALFLPYKKISLIIIDEEQSPDYVQSLNKLQYNGREVALYLAYLYKSKTILGTNTPSITSYYKSLTHKYDLISINDCNTDIEISHELHYRSLTYKTKNIIKQCLTAGEQIMIIRNRHGYIGNMVCSQCGWEYTCDDCSRPLTYHHDTLRMVCHICGKHYPIIDNCSHCHSDDVYYDETSILNLQDDIPFDSVCVENNVIDQQTQNDILNGKIKIVITIPLIAKMIKFNQLALVVVLDMDRLLSYPYYRANELVYNTICDIANTYYDSKIIVQTYQPEHHVYKYINDYVHFYETEIEDRHIHGYPPFSIVIQISCYSKDVKLLYQKITDLCDKLSMECIDIIGIEQPMVYKIRQCYIRTLWIKIARKNINELCKITDTIKIVIMKTVYRGMRCTIRVHSL